jgi:tRNA (guanine37-N1)-methyltransferase
MVEERHVAVLHVDVVSLFPEMFAPVIGLSIVGRAVERGLVEVRTHHLLDALEGNERADERPYGGGPGMVLRIEPIARTLDAVLADAAEGERRRVVLTSASGPVFRQADAAQWSALDRLILICGHYEGVDERLSALYPIEEISLGEFVLTGGEIAAMAFLDATVRLIPGAIDEESAAAESWTGDNLDHPAFTRPPTFRGINVPDVLLSGDHAKIAAWRREQSRVRAATRNRLREDRELERILEESADDDRALLQEFAGTVADGLEPEPEQYGEPPKAKY